MNQDLPIIGVMPLVDEEKDSLSVNSYHHQAIKEPADP